MGGFGFLVGLAVFFFLGGFEKNFCLLESVCCTISKEIFFFFWWEGGFCRLFVSFGPLLGPSPGVGGVEGGKDVLLLVVLLLLLGLG